MAKATGSASVRDSSEKVEKQGESVERAFVSKDTPDAQIIEWDEDGVQVFFEDDMRELPAEVIGKLSKLTVIKYRQSQEIKARLAGEDPEWKEINKNLTISQSGYASPSDIAFGNVPKKGLVCRTVREDRVGYWEAKGYRLAAPEHMRDAKMRKVEGHYEHGTIGAPKEYLMVTTEENRKSLRGRLDRQRESIDASQVEDIKKKAHDAGIKAFDAG